ncbi:MAG TPA: PA2169 family four-helix-bundle protein [Anaerolineales bacterium]|nr:PA2169 family four-helix-bundle protein [Anaerolineales bacterium]
MNTANAGQALVYVYKYVEAGERGYAVVASNVRNRALKILYRACAQQRLTFKEEIFAEIQRLGGPTRPRSNLPGVLHRGRIDIFTALTIGDESVETLLLKEILVGESAALRACEKTLKADLPPETREMLERQFNEVRNIVEQAQLMKGKGGTRLLIRMYDSRQAAEHARQTLMDAGIAEQAIELRIWDHGMDLYQGRGTTVRETVMAGAIGIGSLGFVAGILAALGITQISLVGGEEPSPMIIVLAILGLVAAGIFIGGMAGFFIGLSIKSDDSYFYQDSLEHGEVVVRAIADNSHASKAWQIMKEIVMADKAGQIPA